MHELQRFEVNGQAARGGVAEHIFELSDDVAPHGHAFLEIALVVDGHAQHRAASGRRTLRRGSVVVVRPGEWHSYVDCRRLDICNMYLFGDGAPGGWTWTVPDPLLRWVLSVSWLNPPPGARPPQLSDGRVDRAVRWFDALAAVSPDEVAADTLRSGLVMCVVASLASAFIAQDQDASLVGPHHAAVLEMLRLVQSSLAAPWTVGDLATRVHLSPGHLSRLCRAQLGRPPMELVAMLRAEAAALMLLEADRGVAEVGRAVGYDDPAYFSRRFRLFHGMSPRRYQQSFAARS